MSKKSHNNLEKGVYEQLKEIVETAVSQNDSSKNKYLTVHTNDFYHNDREMLLEDTQKGDELIFMLKSVRIGDESYGHGTYLFYCGRGFDILIADGTEETRYFHLDMDGINSGTVTEVSKQKAVQLSADKIVDPNRVPRRELLMDEIKRVVGIGDDYPIYNSELARDFIPAPGDTTVIKVSPFKSGVAHIEVVRTKIDKDNQNGFKKDVNGYYLPITLEGASKIMEGPNCFLIKTTQQNYAEVTEISQRAFSVAKDKLLDKSSESSLGL